MLVMRLRGEYCTTGCMWLYVIERTLEWLVAEDPSLEAHRPTLESIGVDRKFLIELNEEDFIEFRHGERTEPIELPPLSESASDTESEDTETAAEEAKKRIDQLQALENATSEVIEGKKKKKKS